MSVKIGLCLFTSVGLHFIGVEILSLKVHVFTYKEWKYSYSFPIYLMTLSMYLLVFLYLKGSFEKLKGKAIKFAWNVAEELCRKK